MGVVSVYVDEATERRMLKIAAEKQRSVQDLAECAVSEAALDYFRRRPDDPGRRADGGADIVMRHSGIAG